MGADVIPITITESKFLTHAVADIDSFPYVLEEPLAYASLLLKQVVRVPVGFTTDLYSIPPWLQWLLPRDEGHANAAAIIHDFLYRFGCVNGVALTQKLADQTLAEAMKVKGLIWWRRAAIYRGLRVGGFKAWNDYRRKDAGVPPEIAA